MYALDLLAKNPVKVAAAMQESQYTVTLYSELPGPERRFLGALGKAFVEPDRYYPRKWVFPREGAPLVEARLLALGVLLTAPIG
jgi:hypothetical protein